MTRRKCRWMDKQSGVAANAHQVGTASSSTNLHIWALGPLPREERRLSARDDLVPVVLMVPTALLRMVLARVMVRCCHEKDQDAVSASVIMQKDKESNTCYLFLIAKCLPGYVVSYGKVV